MQNNTFSTLFVGQNLIKLSAVDSTNNFLKNLVSNSEPLPEGTVIMADDQFAGRGQQNNVWKAEPGKNLTFSILLKPTFLAVDKQFFLNLSVSIAINNVLTRILGKNTSIKWPNDLYFGDQKLGGVLIENTLVGNTIKNSIVGIGINVNQQHFEEELTVTATSVFQILQKDVNLLNLLADICSEVESLYLQLRTGKHTNLKENYVDKLYHLNKPALYQKDGEVFEGIIKGVSDAGLLQVEQHGERLEFNFKELTFLNHL
ncbi:biotin--[acetyl-CoA-carboxylase] ligase [Pedobacter insulae]|uniref:BirA family transcriptional regulator, biotin operon repressor / biotin-[acetyl-CoA-carboxylase] ligase n=1 Tax=Pedobacter insulae TaxID=414048 RepID=A0A1I2X890_9SPHI|nr:biotin--[acetyl-CoA-carboxylase] ligase [Pedobacter insulae]SFH09715.1 BirA family transcriptional regulator, biotin operon repressor / biotin-[acetyl-CoA-carboxylase] ligase [Pedobacter insulae]